MIIVNSIEKNDGSIIYLNDDLINSVVFNKEINIAIISMIIWGILNLILWIILGIENRQALSNLPKSHAAPLLYIYFYSGLYISIILLLSGFIGLITRHPLTFILSGISLIIIGAWNCLHNVLLIAAMPAMPFGHSINETGPNVWVIIGIPQLVWGGIELNRFKFFKTKPLYFDKLTRQNAKKVLKDFINNGVNISEGVLEVVIKDKDTNKSFHYLAKLFSDHVLFIEIKIRESFSISKKKASYLEFYKEGITSFGDKKGRMLELIIVEPSLSAFKTWSGAKDKNLLKKDKKICPICEKEMQWAYIEDGSMGDWCSYCKKSLQFME